MSMPCAKLAQYDAASRPCRQINYCAYNKSLDMDMDRALGVGELHAYRLLVGRLHRRQKRPLPLERHDGDGDGDGNGLLDLTRAAEAERSGREDEQHPQGGVGRTVSLNLVRPAGRFGGSGRSGPFSWSSDGEAASMDRLKDSKLVEVLMKCDLLR
jgi:hypothetical protein